jgi:hypothetical protein
MRDGSRYVGEFRADKFCGLGRIETSDGNTSDDCAFSEQQSAFAPSAPVDTGILRDSIPGHITEGCWNEDVCTLQHAIDIAVTQTAHTLAEQALALSETGQSAFNSALTCPYISFLCLCLV